jgi:hypothetical protein
LGVFLLMAPSLGPWPHSRDYISIEYKALP